MLSVQLICIRFICIRSIHNGVQPSTLSIFRTFHHPPKQLHTHQTVTPILLSLHPLVTSSPFCLNESAYSGAWHSAVKPYRSSGVWHILFSILFSRFIHVVACTTLSLSKFSLLMQRKAQNICLRFKSGQKCSVCFQCLYYMETAWAV